MSLQVEEPGAEQQGVGSANDNESICLLNFDVLVRPNGPTSKTNGVAGLRKKWGVKDNDDVVPEPTIAPEGGNIAGLEGATHLPVSTN